jgi:alpha,alpha-trehalose phosphorylase
MGGTWMVFAYGFGGLRDNGGNLSFRPQQPPEAQASLHFSITWRCQLLDIEISPDSTTYKLREGNGLTIRHDGEDITLSSETPAIVRPTLQPLKKIA